MSQTIIADNTYDLLLETDLARDAKPGQFVALYPNNAATLLPRPLSICEVDKDRGRLRLVYRVIGKGTREFCSYHSGDKIEVLGVLGNGFPVEKANGKSVLIMGGGIGIPPMLQLAKELKADEKIILGYRDENLFLLEEISHYGKVYIATEDGSVGSKGTVMDAISENNLSANIIMACGPLPMLRAVKKYAAENNIEAYISLEERMACGVGACLGCVCKTKEVDRHANVNSARICVEGPVFEAKEVDI